MIICNVIIVCIICIVLSAFLSVFRSKELFADPALFCRTSAKNELINQKTEIVNTYPADQLSQAIRELQEADEAIRRQKEQNAVNMSNPITRAQLYAAARYVMYVDSELKQC
jgi:hypothetical protein